MTNNDKLQKIVNNPILWITHFCKIIDKTGKLVSFKLNPEQKELLSDLDKFNLVLKSRQLGITSISCAMSLYYCHVEKGAVCLMMSYSLDSARGIFSKLKQLYEQLPDGIKQPIKNNNRQELAFTNGSKIIVATCGSKETARGLTVKFCHLSEYGFFREDRAKKNLLALEQSLRPDGKIIIESTANGLNHFSEMWQKAENNESLYKPLFFSWVNDKLMFKQEYKMFAKRYIAVNGALPTTNEMSETELKLIDLGATIEQIVWRRLKIANSSEEEFRQEFPSNPTESFLSTGNAVFDAQQIHDKMMFVHNPIETPKEFKGYPITFWKLPQNGINYYAGVDGSEGCGKDYSCIEIIDKDGFQCCELYSNTIKPHTLAEVLHKLCLFYNNSFAVVEKASGGLVVLDKLKNQYHYPNVYKHRSFDSTGRLRRKIGWETTSKTRPIMINDFVEIFSNNECWINSKTLYNEMKLFIDKGGRAEHKTQSDHDDSVIAFSLALQGVKANIRAVEVDY